MKSRAERFRDFARVLRDFESREVKLLVRSNDTKIIEAAIAGVAATWTLVELAALFEEGKLK